MIWPVQRLFSVPIFCLVSIFLKATEAQAPPSSPKHVGFFLYILHLTQNLPTSPFLVSIYLLQFLPKLQDILF